MKKTDFPDLWRRFVHWHGWRDFVRWKGWTAWLKLPVWKALLFPHPALIAVLSLLSAGALIWVFLDGRSDSPIAYPIYLLSAYCFTALTIASPKLIRRSKNALYANPLTHRILTDKELRFRTKLYCRQIIDLAYGTLKTAAGIFYGSSWLLTDGMYNLVQGGIELLQILRRRKELTIRRQWESYRLCGWLVLVLHLFMTGPIFLMINRGKGNDYGQIMVIATAAYAFYKLISSFVGVAKDRRHKAPIDSSVRLMNLTQALFSLFSLQVSMFHTFGGDFEGQALMNNITGFAVSVLVVATGIYMLRRASREIKSC